MAICSFFVLYKVGFLASFTIEFESGLAGQIHSTEGEDYGPDAKRTAPISPRPCR